MSRVKMTKPIREAVKAAREKLDARLDQWLEELTEKLIASREETFTSEEIEEAVSTARYFWKIGAEDALDMVMEDFL